MRVRIVEQEIGEFLKSPEPQILCIFGKWGVGKTFAWDHYLRAAQATHKVTFERYAYVSLFGRSSLADARDAIVEATVDSRVPGLLPNLASFETVVGSAFKLVKLAKPFLPFIPKSSGYGEGVNRLLYLAIEKQIVCLDDLERSGDGLKIGDILGLASELKEQKRCKVVLLLNEEGLADRGTFQQQLEKVADVALAFSPTPEEAADIAIDPEQPFRDQLKAASVDLKLVNIRIIRKAGRLLRKLDELLPSSDPRILHGAARTITLGCFAKYQPGDAPPLDFIRGHNQMVAEFKRKEQVRDNEQSWVKLLNTYGHVHSDELDLALFDAVESGALDELVIKKIVDEQLGQLRLSDEGERYHRAWRPFHETFKDNEEEVLSALERSIIEGLQTSGPTELNAVVGLLRELELDERADVLIKAYMARDALPEFWNLARHHFIQPVDESIRAAFAERFQGSRELMPLVEVVGKIADDRGWGDEDLEIMAAASPNDYYQVFTSPDLPPGADRSSLIEAALRFGQTANADERMRRIARCASEAVRRIGRENRLNSLRVKRYHLTD